MCGATRRADRPQNVDLVAPTVTSRNPQQPRTPPMRATAHRHDEPALLQREPDTSKCIPVVMPSKSMIGCHSNPRHNKSRRLKPCLSITARTVPGAGNFVGSLLNAPWEDSIPSSTARRDLSGLTLIYPIAHNGMSARALLQHA